MEFPQFENINQDLPNNQNIMNYGADNEIEIENMEFSNNNNYQNFPNDNFNPNQDRDINYNNMGWNNVTGGDGFFANVDNAVDELERKRMEDRKLEEEQRRAKIMKKMNDELRIKQEFRDKARDFIENWRVTRENNIKKRHEFNIDNETDYLSNRDLIKDGKKNPWEKVVENIEIKESDYKGTKDVSRMRTVILNRKGDFTQMKMK